MKKILFVMPQFDAGGAEKSLLMLLYMLSKRQNVSVDLMLFKKRGMYIDQIPENIHLKDTEESLRILYSPYSVKNNKNFSGIKCSTVRIVGTFLSRLLVKNKKERTQYRWQHFYRNSIKTLDETYDIACSFLDGESMYYIVDKVQAAKKIGWNQNIYEETPKATEFDAYYYHRLDHIVTLSDECEKQLDEKFPDSAFKILQIPPIVNQDYIKAQAELYIPEEYDPDMFNLVSVGRLVYQKGFDIAISAAKILDDRGIHFRWYIIGDGSLMKDLTEQVQSLSLQDKVIFLGKKENPYPYVLHADLFVQPSRYEGKSVILNEAKMLCRPILCTSYSTVYDQITDGEDGIISDMTAESLAEKLTEMITKPEICKKLTSNLKNKNFDNQKIIHDYLSLFGIE